MSTEDLSNTLDRSKMDEIIITLLTLNIVEMRVFLKFMMEVASEGDKELIKKNVMRLEKYQMHEYDILKDFLYGHFGWTPPDVFINVNEDLK